MSKLLKLLLLISIIITNLPKTFAQDTLSVECNAIKAISVGELPDRFVVSDTIRLSLTNGTDEVLYYAISLQEKIAGKWIDIIEDIFRNENDRPTVKNVRVLLPQEEKVIEWGAPYISGKLPKPNGLCRFFYVIKSSPFDDKEIILSSEFFID